MEHKPIDVTEDTFDWRVLESEVPVLVQFWAPGCEPCSRMAPYVEQLAGEVGDRAVVAKINIDEFPEMAFRLKVHGTPIMKVYSAGEEKGSKAGFRTLEELIELLEKAGL